MYWNEKPYHSLDYEMKRIYGHKIYKLALDGGMTCPNRDGTLGSNGCIFCSGGGSGEFAESMAAHPSVTEQIEAAKALVEKKMSKAHNNTALDCPKGRYIAYFQSYTNTYAPVSRLRALFTEAIAHPDIAILSNATRPDCLPPEIIALLSELNRIKPVWVELGLQTIHEETARFIRRGYPLSVFEDAWNRLHGAGLTVIAHVILGLPGETRSMMQDTVSYLGGLGTHGIDGVKLQLLHVLEGTDLAVLYRAGGFQTFSLEEYLDLVIDCIALLPPETVIHRISGDGPKKLLVAPVWSGNKRLVLNSMAKRFKERGVCQGDQYRTP